MEEFDHPPVPRFDSGWITQFIERRRRLAPDAWVTHWRSVHASGDVASLASCPWPERTEMLCRDIMRLPNHVGLPRTRLLECYPDPACVVGFEYPAEMQLLAARLGPNHKAMPYQERLACLAQLAHTLDKLHAAGVVHRNLDPSAVFWDGEFALLIDACWPDPFDLGADAGAIARLAPERREGADADARSDQYLLAKLWIATGRQLSGNGTQEHALLPQRETNALARALNRNPARRYACCTDFAEALCADLGFNSPHPATDTARGREWQRRLFPPTPLPPVPMSLNAYRALVQPLGRPSEAQIDAYVEYLAEKHSWYKHLPLLLPGAIFTLFINPLAGMIQGSEGDGPLRWMEVGSSEECFHYSMMTTVEYRSRFGHLGFGSSAAPQFGLHGVRARRDYGIETRVFNTVHGELALPVEICEAGSVEVTGVVHENAKSVWLWEQLFAGESRHQSDIDGVWPERSGGAATLKELAAIATDPQRPYGQDKDVEALIVAERQAQFEDLRIAARRVVDLCFGGFVLDSPQLVEARIAQGEAEAARLTEEKPIAEAKRRAEEAEATPPAPVFGAPIPYEIPGYLLLSKLSGSHESSLTEVWLAEHQMHARKVAIKIFKPFGNINSKKFVREGHVLASFDHPNIMRVYEVACVGNLTYLVMEYLLGGTLLQRMGSGTVLGEALGLTVQIAAGLEAAHQQQVVHRDLRPDNIMLRNDTTPVLTNFREQDRGGDRDWDPDWDLDVVHGHNAYMMSPEQVTGEALDGRSDLYALGILFFELLTGQPPFRGRSFRELVLQHLQEPLPQLPVELAVLQPVLDQLLAKQKEDRYPTAQAFIDALRLCFAASTQAADSSSAPVVALPSVATDPPLRPDGTVIRDTLKDGSDRPGNGSDPGGQFPDGRPGIGR